MSRARVALGAYARHTALNLGQALQGARYLHSHPDVDRVAPRGTVEHLARSVALRSRRVANDLFFAAIPPQWHHTAEELASMEGISLRRWFRYGYCAWAFTETGEPKPDGGASADRRWDPRCASGP